MNAEVIETSRENLVMKVKEVSHPADEKASAAYLSHTANVTMEFYRGNYYRITHHKDEIKIYKQTGESYGEFEIYLRRDKNRSEELLDIKGTTYNYDHEQDKMIATKLSEESIFHESINDHYSAEKWAMPNVKAGSLIQIEYTTRSPWIYVIPRFDFQLDIPVDHAEYSFQPSFGFAYNSIPTGSIPLNRTDTEDPGLNGITSYIICITRGFFKVMA